MMQLIFTAVFFFLLAVILMLVALRLTGYLGGAAEEEPDSSLNDLYTWMIENGIQAEMYRLAESNTHEVHLPFPAEDLRVIFAFDEVEDLEGIYLSGYEDDAVASRHD